METDALMVEIAKLESNPKHPITPAVQVPVHKLLRKDEPQEVPKVLKANVAPIQPVTASIPPSDTARKNLTKGKFTWSIFRNFAFFGHSMPNKSLWLLIINIVHALQTNRTRF